MLRATPPNRPRRAASLSLAVALALAAGACGDDPEQQEPSRISVCEAASGEASGRAKLSGRVIETAELAGLTTGDAGFVLSGEGCSIFVAGPGRKPAQVETGQAIEVDGLIAELEDQEAERLRGVFDSQRAEITKGIPGTLRISPGAPFVDAFSLTGETVE